MLLVTLVLSEDQLAVGYNRRQDYVKYAIPPTLLNATSTPTPSEQNKTDHFAPQKSFCSKICQTGTADRPFTCVGVLWQVSRDMQQNG